MNKVIVAVPEYNVSPEKLIIHQEIGLHMIFDIKLGENFLRKATMVAGSHTTNTPSSITYSSVVSRDLVQKMLMIAALKNIDLQAADTENAYLTAPCRKKIWKRAGQNLEWMKERYLLWLELYMVLKVQAQHLGHLLQIN